MSEEHVPTEINYRSRSRVLEVAFQDGERFAMSAEYLRVHSPSAEVRGHGPGQEVLQVGKKNVDIAAVEPVGQYAAGQTEIVRWPLTPGLAVGEYFISCGVSTVEHPYQFLTREVDAYRFAVDGATRSGALCSLVLPPQLGGDAR